MIRVESVDLSYKGRKVLEQVDLEVRPGEALGIIGPSGAGKSVFLKILAGLIVPDSGLVRVESSKVSMLFQKNALFDSFTLLQNLLLPLSETLGINGAEAESRSLAMLKAVGLDHAAGLHPDEISGGMQKRLGIARALIIEPEVILYDEPTAGLDPITSKSIADLMISLHRKNRTTLVMVTNDLQRAYQVSDRIAFCHDRRLRVVGTPDEVRSSSDSGLRRFIYANALIDTSGGSSP